MAQGGKDNGDGSRKLLMKIGMFSTEVLSNNFFALDALRERFCENEAEKQLVRNIYHNELRMLRFMRRCMLYDNCANKTPGTENAELCALLTKLAADIKRDSDGRIAPVTELPKRAVLAAVDGKILIHALTVLAVGAADRGAAEITLKLVESGDTVTISVIDDCKKLDPAKVEDTIDCNCNEPDDFGVGLMAVSAAAAAHGGYLKFKNLRAGNCFFIEIPLKVSKRIKVECPTAEYKDRFGTLQVELCDYYVPGYERDEENEN